MQLSTASNIGSPLKTNLNPKFETQKTIKGLFSGNPLGNKLADQIQAMMKKGCNTNHQKVGSSLNSYKYDEKSATNLI